MLPKQKRINDKKQEKGGRESNKRKRLQTIAEKLNNLKDIWILEIEDTIIKHEYKKIKAEDKDFL